MRTLINKLANEKNLVLIDQAIFSGNTFVSTALLARFLGVENFGVYSSIVLAIYLLISMSNALIIQPLQVAFGKFIDIENYKVFTLFAQLVICILVFSFGITIQQVAPNKFFSLTKTDLLYASFLASFWILHDFFRKLFLAYQRIKKAIVIDSIMAGIQLLSIIGLAVFRLLTLNAAILVVTLGFVISSIAAFLIAEIKFNRSFFSREYLDYHISKGFLLLLSSVIQWWSSNLFVVTSGVFLGAAALGAFRLVQSLFGVLNLLLQTFENYVLPKAAKILSESKLEAQNFLKMATKKGAILFGVVLLPLFIFSKQAIVICGGPEYIPYSYAVRGMVILYTIIYFGYTARIPIRILTLNKSFFIGYCISFAFSLLTFQFLLKNFGLSGAIFGLVVNQILMILFWRSKLTKHNFKLWI